jgi:CRP-like cAMP-binding protein
VENPLIAKLENVACLSDDDRHALITACQNVRDIAANEDVISEGDKPEYIHLMLAGWACRYKDLEEGSRSITAYLVPGDFCDLHVTILGSMDHGIAALTPAKVAFISRTKMDELTRERPELTRALWWATLVDEGVLRAWLVNISRRDGFARVANLICELYERLDNVGLVNAGKFSLPLTQEEIADSTGMTPVHANRILQRLRRDGLLTLKGGNLNLLDAERLKEIAGFDPSYLHPQHLRGA